jgi:hypothetical protein
MEKKEERLCKDCGYPIEDDNLFYCEVCAPKKLPGISGQAFLISNYEDMPEYSDEDIAEMDRLEEEQWQEEERARERREWENEQQRQIDEERFRQENNIEI